MKIILKKMACLLLMALLCICLVPYLLIGLVVRCINKPLSIKMTTIWAYMFWYLFGCILKMSYVLKGENILKNRSNYLVISNHIGSMDFMVLNQLFSEKGMLQNHKYIIKSELKYVPIFYQTVCLLNFLILKRNFEDDKKKILEYLKYMASSKIPACIILYPEGSRFTEERKAKSWEFSEKTGNQKFNNVLFPRFKGLELIGSNIDQKYINEIADITLIHKNKEVPTLWQILFTEIKGEIDFDIKITSIKDISNFKEFLLDSFKRKDHLLDQKRK